MAENEKLLEAARMIQSHCENTKEGEPCIFSATSKCNMCRDCIIGYRDFIPLDWVIPVGLGANQ